MIPIDVLDAGGCVGVVSVGGRLGERKAMAGRGRERQRETERDLLLLPSSSISTAFTVRSHRASLLWVRHSGA